MTFDPFGDFASRGYLRNHAGQKDMLKVKDLEHDSFRGNVERALQDLSKAEHLTYEHVRKAHETLFRDVYPWAGQDRAQTAPDLHITKGTVDFMFASHVGRGVEYALGQGNDPAMMREKPGEVMGNLAYAHPFLDGNGRTIMTVHSELCRRAEIYIDWSQIHKNDYLKALTQEIDVPGKGHLDAYLQRFVREGALQLDGIAVSLQTLSGLGPQKAEISSSVLIPRKDIGGRVSETELKERLAGSESVAEASQKLINAAKAAMTDYEPVVKAVQNAALSGDIGDRRVADELRSGPGPSAARLGAAADSYIRIVHGIRQTMQQQRHDQAQRAGVEVRRPSAQLMAALDRGDVLSGDLKAELRMVRSAFERRFGDDLAVLRAGRNLEGLAARHGIDEKQVSDARRVLQRLGKAASQQRAQAEVRSLDRGGPIR
ncbi:Fic/DOC family protein [Pelagibacterium halotolerans]|uniref:Fic/DOC family protein n=1 Tax=Pelagibacterium halotolerans TaxID=531813 RepID=UPI00384CE975